MPVLRAAEFFAGIGLARMGLEKASFETVWANDIQPKKAAMYLTNFGTDNKSVFRCGDIADVSASDIPADIDLAWCSFPCADLSLAGYRQGLNGSRSSTFFEFVRVLKQMGCRKPPVIAVENVPGLATSRGGNDLSVAIASLNELGYWADVLVLDARRWVPQSRLRLFIVGSLVPLVSEALNSELRPDWLKFVFSDKSLATHQPELLAPPNLLTGGLGEVVEQLAPTDSCWWEPERQQAFVESLSELNRSRLEELKLQQSPTYRTAYRRTRSGRAVWEIRPDDIAGCLRTSRGGSSKQAVVCAGKDEVRVRWMTTLEYARLMGAADYSVGGIPLSQAQDGFGDAVCVPLVEWLGKHYLAPLLAGELSA